MRRAIALWCCLLAGCALLTKSKPREVRYFEPLDAPAERSLIAQAPARTDATTGGESGQRLRLGTVKAARHLDVRIVARRGAHELGYYEELRWTERPEQYVRRALERDLYEQAGLTRVVSGAAPTLEVQLLAFEEREQGGQRRAYVELQTVLHDERMQLDQQTVRVETAVDAAHDDRAEALVAALGDALLQATQRITERTQRVLAQAAPSAAPTP